MAAFRIVEGFYVFRDLPTSNRSILVDLFLNMFLFQTAEERFGDGVVPAVSPTAHAGNEVVGAAEALPAVATVLRSLIRVNDVDQTLKRPDSSVRVASREMLLDLVVASPELLPMSVCHHVAFQPGRRYGQEDDTYVASRTRRSNPSSLSVGYRQVKA